MEFRTDRHEKNAEEIETTNAIIETAKAAAATHSLGSENGSLFVGIDVLLSLNHDPLDLIEAHIIPAPIIEASVLSRAVLIRRRRQGKVGRRFSMTAPTIRIR